MSKRYQALLAALLLGLWPGAAQAEQTFAIPVVSKGIFLTRGFRNPTFAAAASMVIPGGGQVYNDDIAKFLAVLAGLGVSAAILYTSRPSDQTTRYLAGTGFGIVYLWSVGDAYLSAATYNKQLEQEALP